MSTGNGKIARVEVAKLAENLKDSADEVLGLVGGKEIDVDRLLVVTRYMARSARRMQRKLEQPTDEPAQDRPRKHAASRKHGSRNSDPRPRQVRRSGST